MVWAILWGFIIGGASNSGGAGFLAFLVIWYFEDKSHNAASVINALQQKIFSLESETRGLRERGENNRPVAREKEWYEWMV